MANILRKERLNPSVTRMDVFAPRIAQRAQAGQFVILRLDELGERIPLTIAGTDAADGLVTIIYQKVGLTTNLLDQLEVGDDILDFVGPLGRATDLPQSGRVAIIGGGVGCAIAYPQAAALHKRGVQVDVITGFRTAELVILQQELAAASDHLYLMTDDGTAGERGLVTEKLKALIGAGAAYDLIIAIGPIPMMKFVCKTSKPYGIPTVVSLNPIMIDGTGMCGGCRVTVGGAVKFACVDGPDFDGQLVDFDELISRNSAHKQRETELSTTHICRLLGQKEGAN